MLQMQSDFDDEKARLKSKINELAVALDRAKQQVSERDQSLQELASPRKPLVIIFIPQHTSGIRHAVSGYFRKVLAQVAKILRKKLPVFKEKGLSWNNLCVISHNQ